MVLASLIAVNTVPPSAPLAAFWSFAPCRAEAEAAPDGVAVADHGREGSLGDGCAGEDSEPEPRNYPSALSMAASTSLASRRRRSSSLPRICVHSAIVSAGRFTVPPVSSSIETPYPFESPRSTPSEGFRSPRSNLARVSGAIPILSAACSRVQDRCRRSSRRLAESWSADSLLPIPLWHDRPVLFASDTLS